MRTTLRHYITVALLALIASVFLINEAEAKRMGGSRSFGRQSTQIHKSSPTPINPQAKSSTSTRQSQATPRAQQRTPDQRSGFSRFLGPLAGLAAGLGIAALLSSLGIGGALLEILSSAVLIGLIAMAGVFVWRRFLRPQTATASMANQSTGAFPGNVDRNVDHSASFPSATTAPSINTVASPSAPADLPTNFDTYGFLEEAKKQFVHLQTLWDRGDLEGLRAFMSDRLFAELQPEIATQTGFDRTEIILLNAELVDFTQLPEGHVASLRFSGLIKEQTHKEAEAFEEVWHLLKTPQNGWLLDGIQQLA